MTKAEAIEFCTNNPEAAAEIILMVEKLQTRVKELETRLGMNIFSSACAIIDTVENVVALCPNCHRKMHFS